MKKEMENELYGISEKLLDRMIQFNSINKIDKEDGAILIKTFFNERNNYKL